MDDLVEEYPRTKFVRYGGQRYRMDWVSPPTLFIRGHELPAFIVTFDGMTLPYGELGL